MKKTSLISIVAFLFAVASVVFYPHVVASGNTVYASGFEAQKFDGISDGLSADTLKELLGEPIRLTKQEDETRLWYSDRKNDTHFYQKIVVTKNGIVSGKVDELYFD